MLTVSIVVYDSPLDEVLILIECLKRTEIQTIWLIYNGDKSKKHLFQSIGEVEFIETENRGFSAAHNIAINLAQSNKSEYHLILNPDVYWHGDVITPLINKLIEDDSIGLIAPDVRNIDGTLQYTCRMLPTPFGLIGRRMLPSSFFKASNDMYLLKHIDHTKPILAPYIMGCFMLLRMDAIQKCGAFDERFFMYPEDIDLTRRINRHWKTVYDPCVKIYHSHRRKSSKSFKYLLIHCINMIRYFNKWGWFFDKERKRINSALKQQISSSSCMK